MGWDDGLFDLLDDLEGQAEALYAAEREAELADRSRAAYAEVTLASRLMASVGRAVSLEVAGVGNVRGEPSRRRRVVPGVGTVGGLAGATGSGRVGAGTLERSVPEVAWSPVSRLGLGSALRRLADDATRCLVSTRSGTRHEVVLTRVGANFMEGGTVGAEPGRLLLALDAIGAVQSRDSSTA